MNYGNAYHLNQGRPHTGGIRYGRHWPKQRLWSFPAIMIIVLMILPLDYLTALSCPMMAEDHEHQEASTCCPHSEHEENDGEDPDHAASNPSCDHASDMYEASLTGMNCGCFFTPGTANNDLSKRDATLSDMSTGLLASGGFAVGINSYPTVTELPVSTPLKRSAPLYVINQVFLI